MWRNQKENLIFQTANKASNIFEFREIPHQRKSFSGARNKKKLRLLIEQKRTNSTSKTGWKYIHFQPSILWSAPDMDTKWMVVQLHVWKANINSMPELIGYMMFANKKKGIKECERNIRKAEKYGRSAYTFDVTCGVFGCCSLLWQFPQVLLNIRTNIRTKISMKYPKWKRMRMMKKCATMSLFLFSTISFKHDALKWKKLEKLNISVLAGYASVDASMPSFMHSIERIRILDRFCK